MADQYEIDYLKMEIDQLRTVLRIKEELLREKIQDTSTLYNGVLTNKEVIRYSRQMIIPSINPNGQVLLKNSKVLIIGVGGLGCPASLYLASAGVGEITLVDYDDVELSNLHRQILHDETFIAMSKVTSAYNKLISMNSSIKINSLNMQVNSKTIEEIIKTTKYNVVLDCSDNVATRYLLNDVCVLNNIPLVSGSALQMDGQLTVYNYKGGPCYRCLFPDPPPSETVMNCGDAGVLGAVTGVIGVLQALEAIKVITSSGESLSGKYLVFDATDTSFRRIRLRERNSKCALCGDNPSIKTLIDYEQFCGSKITDKVDNISILNTDEHIGIKEVVQNKSNNLILDVRPELEFKMCNLPGTVNFPFSKIEKGIEIDHLKNILQENLSQEKKRVYVLCRRGNDSQRAIILMKKMFTAMPIDFLNVKGGLYAYSKDIDKNFPVY